VATGDDCSAMLEAEIPKGYSSAHGVPSPCAFTAPRMRLASASALPRSIRRSSRMRRSSSGTWRSRRDHSTCERLTRTYGCEIIFVGSGGMIDYPNREQAEHNLQDELAVMIRQHEAPLAPRPAAPNPLLAAAKRAVKRAMGRVEVDLYDLGAWTVWAAPRAVSEPPRVEQANGQVQLTACRLSFRRLRRNCESGCISHSQTDNG